MLVNFGKERGFINFTWKEFCVACGVIMTSLLIPAGTFVWHAIETNAEFAVVKKELVEVKDREKICEARLNELERLLLNTPGGSSGNGVSGPPVIAPDYTKKVER